MALRIYPFGENALVLAHEPPASIDIQRRIWTLAAAAKGWSGVAEAVAGMNNLTVFFEAGMDRQSLESQLAQGWEHSGAARVRGDLHDVAVRYGGSFGPDLTEVAKRCGMSEAEVVRLHCEREFEVYFLGFQPGFAYLGDLDRKLEVPRRSEPRSAVPARSVAIAGMHTAIYPLRAPGGWHVIGSTEVRPFDLERSEPVLFKPGDRVRFRPVDAA